MSLITRVAVVTLAALFAAPALAQTKPASFPDEYYYRNNEGKRRPEYKKLEGKPVPAISVGDWIGSAVDVKDAKGKVVVIDFWATWCGPCMKSIPKNVELVDEFKDKGLVFVGVHDFNDGWDKAAAVVKSNKINYPVGRDATGGVSQKRFGVISWPTYIVVDKFGIVRAAGLVPSRVRDVVSVLIDEPGPKPGEAGMSEFPADYYVAGSRRPKSLIDIEGKLLADLPAATAALDAETSWLGEALTAPARKDKPLVLAFIAPGPGIKDAKALSALADKWAMSSVNVIGVCDASAKWDTFTKVVASNKLTFAAMHDKLSDEAAKENDTPEGKLAPKRGNLADALGVKTFPTYIVIDADGKVRAAGVKADKLDAVIDAVLSTSPTQPSKIK